MHKNWLHKNGLDHTIGEHIADGIVHALGVLAALSGAILLVVWAATSAPAGRIPPLIIYSIGLIATFSLSAAYNMTLHPRARAILRRFDHAAIFIMIAGTYTPLALIGIGGTKGVMLASAVWVIAVVGVFLKLFLFNKFYRLGFALYLLQGWLAVLAIGPMTSQMNTSALILIIVGGLTYTVGTVFHHRDNWPFNKAIWHGFVLAGCVCHFFSIYYFVEPI